jgi:membrane protease YdiL (CAAX protease family)
MMACALEKSKRIVHFNINCCMNKQIMPKQTALLQSILYWMLFVLLLWLFVSLTRAMGAAPWNRFFYGMLGITAAFLAIWCFLKYDKEALTALRQYWGKFSIYAFLRGVVWGMLIFAAIIAILLLFTGLQLIQNTATVSPSSFVWILPIIPLALMEEMAFRGYPFVKLKKAFGLHITQVIVAIFFALYHIIQGWDVSTAFLGPAIWSFVFGWAAARSGGIALPTGIHVALNLGQVLVGLKGSTTDALWLLEEKTGAHHAIARAEIVGIITHLLVLVCAVIFTEQLVRKNRHE